MPAPTNITALLATDLGTLPISTSQQVDDSGTTYTVWYKYTAGVADDDVGFWFFGDLTTYMPTVEVMLGPASAPVDYLTGYFANNVPIVVPVTPGTTYYFQVSPNAGNPSPANLTISGLAAPKTATTEGQILITEFGFDGDAALVDNVSGDVAGYRRLLGPADRGETLTSGLFAVDNGDTGDLDLYAANFSAIASVPMTLTGLFNAISSNRTDTFVAAHATGAVAATVKSVDTTGAVLTTWTLPANSKNLGGMSPTRDLATLYYTKLNVVNEPIHAYDLTNSVALPDLVGGRAAVSALKDMFVLPNGDVFVPYTDNLVYRYSSAGATVQTYTISGTIDRLRLALDDLSFWVETQSGGATPSATFRKILISDGSILTTVTTPLFTDGISEATAALSMERFGVSNSCPLLLVGPQDTPVGTQTYPLRRLRRFVLPFNNNLVAFIDKLEFVCQAGVGLSAGPTGSPVQGENPVIMIRISRDGGSTWTPERWLPLGKMGQYARRAVWRSAGSYRDGVVEITVSDPVFATLMAVAGDITPGIV